MRQASDMGGFTSLVTPWSMPSAIDGGTIGVTTSYSAYTQLTAGLPQSISGFWLAFYSYIGVVMQVTIGIGTAGQEVDCVADLYNAGGNFSGYSHQTFFPFPVPAGTRISWRAKGPTASSNIQLRFLPVIGTYNPITACDNYSVAGVTMSSSGTSAWTQIVANTLRTTQWLTYGVGASGTTNYDGYIDIGMGPAGSEQSLLNGLDLDCRGAGSMPVGKLGGGFPIVIPAGSRLACRSTYRSNTAGAYNVSLHMAKTLSGTP